MKKVPIIIDTDPGVDDAYAIAMAHACPMLDVRAITAVEGNVPAKFTRRNALYLAEKFGINCRVAYGAELPLKKDYSRFASIVHGDEGLGSIQVDQLSLKPDPMPAWDVIYDESVRAQGEMILLAVGPLTNIALALQHHPDLPKYIKRFYIMGGGLFGNVSRWAEFNIWVDPTAAKEVFEKMEVYMVGLNVTHQAAITQEEFDAIIEICSRTEKNITLQELSVFSRENCKKQNTDNHIIHDAITVASIIDPELIRFEPHSVWVEDDPKAENEGQTVVEDIPGKAPNCYVGMDIDRQKFLEMLKETCEFYNQ